MKRFLTLIVTAILLGFLFIPALAYSSERTAELVVDEVQVFSEDELQMLTEKAEALSQKYDCDIIIYTAPNFPKETETDSLHYLLSQNNYGSGEQKSAIIFTYFEAESWVALMTQGFAEEVYTAYGLDYFLDDPIAVFNQGLWYDGFNLYLEKLDAAFATVLSRKEGSSEAAEYTGEKTADFVVDEAGILTEEERVKLNEKAEAISTKFNSDVVLYTVQQYKGLSVEEGAEIVYEENSYGAGEDRSVIMLLLSFAERDYDIMAHGYANLVFTDFGKERLSESFKPHFKNDNWYEGFDAYLNRVEEFFEYEQEGTPVDVNSDPYDVMSAKDYLITIGVALIPALLIVLVMKFQMKSAVAQDMANAYIPEKGLNLTKKTDRYLRKSVSRKYSPKSESKGSSGGTSTNSGGFSHSSGKF